MNSWYFLLECGGQNIKWPFNTFILFLFFLVDYFRISCGHPIFFATKCKRHNIKNPPNIIFLFFFNVCGKKSNDHLIFFSPMWKIEYWVATSYNFWLYIYNDSFKKKNIVWPLDLVCSFEFEIAFCFMFKKKNWMANQWFSSHMWGKNVNDYLMFFFIFLVVVWMFFLKTFIGAAFIFQSFQMFVKCFNFFLYFFLLV